MLESHRVQGRSIADLVVLVLFGPNLAGKTNALGSLLHFSMLGSLRGRLRPGWAIGSLRSNIAATIMFRRDTRLILPFLADR